MKKEKFYVIVDFIQNECKSVKLYPKSTYTRAQLAEKVKLYNQDEINMQILRSATLITDPAATAAIAFFAKQLKLMSTQLTNLSKAVGKMGKAMNHIDRDSLGLSWYETW